MIFAITHKKDKVTLPKGYSYLSVNSKNTNFSYYDSVGDNISLKNKNYCELTGLYWVWKNTNFPTVGLVHYRRFFITKNDIFGNWYIPDEDELSEHLKTVDIILPKKRISRISVKREYGYFHYYKDLKKCCDYIVSKDKSFKPIIKKYLNSKETYCYNMFFTSRKIIDKYCVWLFDVLNYVELRININKYSDYQKRIFGFLSERLFNIWIAHQRLKVKELPVFFSEKNDFDYNNCNFIEDNKPFDISFLLKGKLIIKTFLKSK